MIWYSGDIRANGAFYGNSCGYRRYPRHEIPAVIEAPSISAFPLVPENISVGGFGLVLPAEPDLEMGYGCTIRVADKVFKECRARVVRLQVLETAPSSWHVGFTLALPNGRGFWPGWSRLLARTMEPVRTSTMAKTIEQMMQVMHRVPTGSTRHFMGISFPFGLLTKRLFE